MHTEDVRACRAANYFRSLLKFLDRSEIPNAEELLAAADAHTGYQRIRLPPVDPLLAGGHALIDREFQTIWLSNARTVSNQHVDAAHEYGHLILHGSENVAVDLAFQETVDGYSKNQRDERDSHRFAAEFLLPLRDAKLLFLRGLSATEISQRQLIPRYLVIRQLLAAFGEDNFPFVEDEQNNLPEPDSWQAAAINAEGSAIVRGGPGTGKTMSLIARCRNLVETFGVESSKVLVIGESAQSAQRIRKALRGQNGSNLEFIPVATPHQFAYDVLVRFPEASGLSREWEQAKAVNRPTPEQYIDLALTVIEKHEHIVDSINDRYLAVIVDNFDLLSASFQQLALRLGVGARLGLWLTTAGSKRMSAVSEDANDFLRGIKSYELAFQYRSSSALASLSAFLNANNSKTAVNRRPPDLRCGKGSVTFAFYDNNDQLVDGVAGYVEKHRSYGYRLSDFLAVQKSLASTDVALRQLLVERLADAHREADKLPQAIGLLGFLCLCFGGYDRGAIVSCATLKRYLLSSTELAELARGRALESLVKNDGKSNRVDLLFADLQWCRKAKNLREALELYAFEVTDYLRVNPDAGEAVRFLWQILKDDNNGIAKDTAWSLLSRLLKEARPTNGLRQVGQETIEFLDWREPLRRSSPIVIVIGAKVDRLAEAVSVVGDHLLYCIYSRVSDSSMQTVRRQFGKCDGIEFVDWRSKSVSGHKRSVSHAKHGLNLTQAERVEFAQCPRRTYYSKIVDKSESASSIRLDKFPAVPADSSMCDRCRYADICPVELN